MGEAGKASPVEIDGERLIRCAKGVDAHVELSASEEQRVEQVALTDIWLGRAVAVEGLPSRDVVYFIENENTFALAFRSLRYEGWVQAS